MSETNADIRRELLRKVGIERMLANLPHKVVSKRGDYELLSVDLTETVKGAIYLKMLNQSIGVYHMEGVPRECKTVDEALSWRNGGSFIDAEVLT
jgi:hypothetical protein